MKKIKIPDHIFLFRFKLFNWVAWVSLRFDCWLELFIIYLAGHGEKRLILQTSILEISTCWQEKDKWIKEKEKIGEKTYRVLSRNPKYDGSEIKFWSWSIKDMKIETRW